MKKHLIYLSAFILFACNSKSQETHFKEVFSLDKKHNEISGMTYHKPSQKIWMLQDKGNPSELYVYTTEGTFEKTITVKNQENTDWEDLSQDQQGNLYIGNFGNNKNDRQDLRILKVDAATLQNNEIESSQETTFYYEDQQSFPPKKGDLLYDCEAFVATKDAFYLFTKNRAKGFDGTFYVYKVPNQAGNFKAVKLATLKTCDQYKNCAITGAAMNAAENKIALSTHNKVFLIDFKNDASFTQDNLKVVELNHHSQKEALTFKNDKELFISDESEKAKGEGKVYVLDLN